MRRTVYAADHEAFRESVEEFVTREVEPRAETFAEQRLIGPEVWRAAGRQGLLGLEIPEEFGGSAAGDYRFNAVLHEELAAHGMALASGFGIHFDIVAPYLADLTTRGAEEAVAARLLLGRAGDRDRDDRAGRRLRPGGADDERRTGWGSLGAQRVQDLHHQRLPGRAGDRRGPDQPRQEGHHAVRRRGRDARVRTRPASSTRWASTRPTRPSCSSATCAFPPRTSIGEVDGGFVAMMERLPQERLGAAVANLAHAWSALAGDPRLREGAAGVRAAGGVASSTTSSPSPTWSPSWR